MAVSQGMCLVEAAAIGQAVGTDVRWRGDTCVRLRGHIGVNFRFELQLVVPRQRLIVARGALKRGRLGLRTGGRERGMREP